MFLALGLAGVNALAVDGADADGCRDAVGWIAELRQATDLSRVPVGRRVVVIGGGMTAIDAAVQSKLLGAEEVTIAYRRGQEAMKASLWEQELAQTRGVTIRHRLSPLRVETDADGEGLGRRVHAHRAGWASYRCRRIAHHRGGHGVQGDRPDVRTRTR